MGPLKWYDANAKDNPEFLKALAEVRRIGCMKGGVTTTSKQS